MLVSIIVLNYNTPDITEKCLGSIIQNLDPTIYELIVVDNYSSYENLEKLKTKLSTFTNVQVIFSDFNRGYGGGNMLGALHAKGDFICFMNSDVELIEDCITPAYSYLQAHPSVGCVSPQQLNAHHEKEPSFDHGPSIIKELFGKGILEQFSPQKYPKRKYHLYKKPLEVVHTSGSMMILPTHLFFKVGGFDPNIFLYYEEYDISTRLKKEGYASVFIPMFSYLHIHGATIERTTGQSKAMCEAYKSKLYVYKKYHNIALYSFYFLLNVLKLMTKPKLHYLLPHIHY
jgi:GT2 family glycosyltransferase